MRTQFEQDREMPRRAADESAVPEATAGLHRQVRGIVAAVVVLSRLATLAMVAVSVVGAVHSHAYTRIPLAGAVYAVLVGWSAVLITLVLRHPAVPAGVLVADVIVTAGTMIVLPLAVSNPILSNVSNSYLEPITVSVAVAVALISGSARATAAGCSALAVAYVIAQAPLSDGGADIASLVSTIGWQVGTATCSLVFIQRLRRAAHQVDVATAQVITARERLAAQRAHTEERTRHFREQVRRYRDLHDGPLRILTVIAGPGPAAHPDPVVRRHCAVSVNILRGAAPDETGGTLTDLSLALMEAGGESAALGLRVEYHFANLPDDLPAEVVTALCRASAEALSNVAAHAGTSRARLTAMTSGDGGTAVTVAIVDQGKGFDPATTELGYGIRHSIIERMTEIGGAATVDSHPGEGTRIDLRWPA
ncbi:MAG TPA: ATP-binding protein [Actinophytocola sp.]|uniref:sensor histidine kinase n=1 Tax=Actinophytocola sp. TaxID=1872138 RepID=UPI002DDC9880|nr:ATP-binding protein [Actinophytocola sp.]HEV2778211.1 ATP-binding protein [Actinophytocola sp.]